MHLEKRVFVLFSRASLTVVGGLFLALSALSLFGIVDYPIDPAWGTVAICGYPLVYLAIYRIVFERKISSALLISVAMFAAIYIDQLFAAGEVAFIMAIGALLEERIVERAERGVRGLADLVPSQGRRVAPSGDTEVVPIDQIEIGDIVRVFPGESLPVDGIISSGNSSINQSVMTGESLPVDCTPGDSVFCGTINMFGSIDVAVTGKSADSSLQKLIDMVGNADNDKSPVQRITDRWATWLVPIALAVAVITGLATRDIVRAVTVLVVFCPCALALAAPTTIVAAIGQATKHGILIKSGRALEMMGEVDRIVFDKTGTLTFGALSVSGVFPFGEWDRTTLLTVAGSIESYSEHPLAKAVAKYSRSQILDLPKADGFKMVSGRGVEAVIDGKRVLCGNKAHLEDNGVFLNRESSNLLSELRNEGAAVVLVAVDGSCIGCLTLSDIPRPFMKEMISDIRDAGAEVTLLSGDHAATVAAAAKQVGIDDFRADALPADKMDYVRGIQKEGRRVCMVGDGVNDAPVLKAADIGVVMGDIGSDISIDAADIVLLGDDISKMPYLIRLSKGAVRTIWFNISVSMCINFVAVLLSVWGILDPITGALVHNVGSVLVVANAALFYDRNFIQRKHKRVPIGAATS